jgi:NAD(P)-dependent dehydrogenase (short-subunit alcohol dehydrogenase family)
MQANGLWEATPSPMFRAAASNQVHSMVIAEKSFLITGGASGLGFACAEMLVRGGGFVTIADLNRQQGERAAAKFGSAAQFVATDVTREEDVSAAVQAAVSHRGGLHGAVCCAGIAIGERLVGKQGPHRLDSFARVLAVNVIGTFNTLRLAAAQMVTQEPDEEGERGVLITTASVAAFDGQIGQAAYSASKGAVASMTLPIARELARHGVRCVAIAPGIFDTAMMAGMSEDVRSSLTAQVPFPPRLAHILGNSMLNGTVIRLDGALRMGAK